LKIGPRSYLYQLFTRVGTYVQRGSKFCFVVVVLVVVLVLLVLGVTDIAQNPALLSNFAMHSALHSGLAWQILHYYPISPYIQKYFEFRPISTGFGLRAMHAEIFQVSTNFDRI
jgi:hypothetical protein